MSSDALHKWRSLSTTLCFIAAGCGGGTDGLGRVTGTVTLDGRPLPNAAITFLPASGRPSWARTDDQGQYRLKYTAEEDGAVPGLHRVIVSTFVERDQDSSDPLIQQGRMEIVPEQYNKRSRLQVDVLPGQHQNLDFVLQSAEDRSPES